MSRKEQKSKQGVENVELLLKLLQEKIRGPYENATISDSNTFSKNTKENCVFWENFIWRIFQCFLQESLQEIIWQFSLCFKLFREDFYGTVCRYGKGGLIPVKSRCNCGNPDRDCTENTLFFCSAMSTKSEIVKPLSQRNR